MTVRDRDNGYRKLTAALEDLAKGVKVTVGVHADRGAEDHRGPSDASVIDVAVIQEFAGRSYLRSTIDESRGAIQKALSAAGQRAIKSAMHGRGGGGEVQRAFGRVATRFARKVQARIRRMKLIATGQLLDSIEGRVNGENIVTRDDLVRSAGAG